MGIHGLTTYVDTLPFGEEKVWEPYDLHDTNLVIDGCGLYYHIHTSNHLNIKYGGQYDKLQSKLKEFFSKLKLNNVIPYVVVDGIMAKDEKKFDTYVRRKKDCIRRMKSLWSSKKQTGYDMVIPRLAQMAFVQLLQELQVQYAIADFEADCEIASLANELNAPVMGNDSDFYIFNINHGYIPFQHYQFSGTNITVKKFSFDGLAKYLAIDPNMSPLLASLVGNDYISDIMLRPFTAHIQKLDCGNKKCKVPTIAKFLSGCKSASEAFAAVLNLFPEAHRPAFEQALKLSIEEYQAKQSNLIGYFHSGDLSCDIVTYNSCSIPQWIVQLYREGSIATEGLMCLSHRKVFLQTQCEDTSLPSAQECVQDLRWYYYTLVLQCEDTHSKVPVTELQPQSNAMEQSTVTQGQTEAGTDYDHAPAPRVTPESKALRDIKGYNDTLLAGEQQQGRVKLGQTNLETDCDHTHVRGPTPEFLTDINQYRRLPLAVPESHGESLSPMTESHQQSKDGIPSMDIGQTELETDSDHTLRMGVTPDLLTPNEVEDDTCDLAGMITGIQIRDNTAARLGGCSIDSEEVASSSNCDHSINDTNFANHDDTPEAIPMGNMVKDNKLDIIVTEFDREGSTYARKKINITLSVPDTKTHIHDLPNMTDAVKKSQLLSLLESNLPFIQAIPIKHQLVVSALRYWVSHSNVKEIQLAALLVHYVGEKRSSSNQYFNVAIETVHGFSQWQNVVYWAGRLNSLFSTVFPQLEVEKLYHGVHLCLVYKRLSIVGIKLAESIVTNANLYRQLHDVITEDLPRDCQFNQSRRGQRTKPAAEGDTNAKQEKQTKAKNKDCLKGNKFALLCEESDSDED